MKHAMDLNQIGFVQLPYHAGHFYAAFQATNPAEVWFFIYKQLNNIHMLKIGWYNVYNNVPEWLAMRMCQYQFLKYKVMLSKLQILN